jgi:hypothetical protein
MVKDKTILVCGIGEEASATARRRSAANCALFTPAAA